MTIGEIYKTIERDNIRKKKDVLTKLVEFQYEGCGSYEEDDIIVEDFTMNIPWTDIAYDIYGCDFQSGNDEF